MTKWPRHNTSPTYPKFSAVFFDLDDVLNLKPHLEPYLKAAEILDVTPSTFVVFEDSVAGFVAARAAGMLCVDVGQVALAAEGGEAPDMAIASFEGFDIWNVRPF